MNILHINTNDLRGGAAKIPYRLMKAQNEIGFNSKMLVGIKETKSKDTFAFDIKKKNNDLSNEGYQYYDLLGSFFLHENKLFQEADIIHLHNLHGDYFNPYALSYLSHLKPIVWSLHDMHSVTGHCGYSYECTRWIEGCGRCPTLDEYPSLTKDRTHENWVEKKDIYRHSKLFIVPTANWIGEIASKGILNNFPMEVVLNGVDINIYRPKNKQLMRKKYGIPTNKIIIGAVANGGTFGQNRKGGKYVQFVVDSLIQQGYDILLVNVGGNNKGFENEFLYNLGYISTEEEMAEIYSTFDIYLFPSIADTCPLVISEAMACGVPVVTFETGGIPEIVQHGKTGYVAPYKDEKSLFEYTKRLVDDVELRKNFGNTARQYCVDHFDHNLIVQKYSEIYSKAIEYFHNRKNEVLFFDFEKVPSVIRDTEEFRFTEVIKTKKLTKKELSKQNIYIVSNEKINTQHHLISVEQAKTMNFQGNDIVFVKRAKYHVHDSYFNTMLYNGFEADVLLSTIVLTKLDGSKFFKISSGIIEQKHNQYILDTSIGGIFYRGKFFNENRLAILNGEKIPYVTKEEYCTELVRITINDYLKQHVNQPIYIYGAGSHTISLIEQCPDIKKHIISIIDSNINLHGKKLLNEFDIVSIDGIDGDKPILISSATFEREIFEQLRNKVNNPLITIYNN